jgi:hypothetical protein
MPGHIKTIKEQEEEQEEMRRRLWLKKGPDDKLKTDFGWYKRYA